MSSHIGPSFASPASSAFAFSLDPIWHLRATITSTTPGWRHLFRTAVTTSTQAAVSLHFHVRAQPPVTASMMTTIHANGFLYGTLTLRTSLADTKDSAAAQDALSEIARACSLVLQHLETLAWLDYCHTQPAQPPLQMPTAREREILVHIAQGFTRSALSPLLTIAPATVKKHVENLYRKFAVHNLAQALAVGRDAGLLRYLL